MGACESRVERYDKEAAEDALFAQSARQLNADIEKQLLDARNSERKIIKCLLLGAGECGKSTILKQMRILHLNGWSTEERKTFRTLVQRNTIESVQSLIEACETLEIRYTVSENQERAERVKKVNALWSDFPGEIVEDIKVLWKDAAIQRAVARGAEFNLLDSAEYFMENIDRTFSADYVPTQADILRSRQPTIGITQTDFELQNLKFQMFDVGGQRGERKKWIHCFDSVNALFFIASLSDFDQTLAEDRSRNRMSESILLFEGVINLRWFRSAPVILFLNKRDIFRRKIGRTDLGTYFPAYMGGLDYERGIDFIRAEFYRRNNNPAKQIYCHVTDATNTENIAFVWRTTQHIMIQKAVDDMLLA